ncbi:MAG: AEC family transporter [Oscillospiraceae bacterium]|jgi:malonate transporter
MDLALFGLNTVVPILIVVMTGYLLGRTGAVSDSANVDLSRLYSNVLLPCTMFSTAYGSNLRENLDFGFIGFCVAVYAATFVLACIIFPKGKDPGRSFVLNHAFYRNNIAIYGIALFERMFPGEDESNLAAAICIIIFINSVICEIQISRYGGRQLGTPFKRIFMSPLVIAGALGMIVSLAGLKLPQMITGAVDMMGKAATAVAFLSLGVSLDFRSLKKCYKTLGWFMLVKLLLIPAAVEVLGCYVFGVHGSDTAVLLSLFATPPAVVTFAVAKTNSSWTDSELANTLVAVPTLVSVLTLLVHIEFLGLLGAL